MNCILSPFAFPTTYHPPGDCHSRGTHRHSTLAQAGQAPGAPSAWDGPPPQDSHVHIPTHPPSPGKQHIFSWVPGSVSLLSGSISPPGTCVSKVLYTSVLVSALLHRQLQRGAITWHHAWRTDPGANVSGSVPSSGDGPLGALVQGSGWPLTGRLEVAQGLGGLCSRS